MTVILKFCDSDVSPIERQFATEAREWVGIRFRHQGRHRETGVDCLGFVLGAARGVGEDFAAYDNRQYGHRPDAKALQDGLNAVLSQCPIISPGRIGLFEVDGQVTHLGIFTIIDGDVGLVHAYAPARLVVEHRLTEDWRERLRFVYALRDQNS